MTWLLVPLSILSLSVNALMCWLLWSHLQAMQSIQRAMKVRDRPEHLATPAPEPGTMWVASEQEQARLEQEMLDDSDRRATAPSRNGSKKRSGRSARPPV